MKSHSIFLLWLLLKNKSEQIFKTGKSEKFKQASNKVKEKKQNLPCVSGGGIVNIINPFDLTYTHFKKFLCL